MWWMRLLRSQDAVPRPRPHSPLELFRGEVLGGATHHSPSHWPKFLRWRKRGHRAARTELASWVLSKNCPSPPFFPACALAVSVVPSLPDQPGEKPAVGQPPSARPARRQLPMWVESPLGVFPRGHGNGSDCVPPPEPQVEFPLVGDAPLALPGRLPPRSPGVPGGIGRGPRSPRTA